jgi:hypothetical protein
LIANFLAARVKITSYNHHCSAPFFRALGVYRCQVYSVKGADAVIQSALVQSKNLYFLSKMTISPGLAEATA